MATAVPPTRPRQQATQKWNPFSKALRAARPERNQPETARSCRARNGVFHADGALPGGAAMALSPRDSARMQALIGVPWPTKRTQTAHCARGAQVAADTFTSV